MSNEADITVIGAGVVGLATASQLANGNRQVYVIERNETFGKEQSSRNSEVIHASIYYERNSLKAKLCLEGNELLYELCEKNGIAYKKCGKIIIAINDIEAAELEKLYQLGRDNGAPLRMLSQKEMGQLEPNLKGAAAFLSPSTGIIDSHALLRYFHGKACSSGAEIVYKSELVGIQRISDGYELTLKDDSGIHSFTTKVLINCAGLHSDRVAEMAGINIDEENLSIHYCKGEFYSVSGGKNKLINGLIYPVPMDISVGVHVCFDVDWRLRLGPLFYYVDEISYKIDDSRKNDFLSSSMMQALPIIEPADIEPESSGIMAMLQAKGEGFRDFVIRHEHEKGLPGFINLVGIDSPGLTSSPAIAEYVSQIVKEIL